MKGPVVLAAKENGEDRQGWRKRDVEIIKQQVEWYRGGHDPEEVGMGEHQISSGR